VLAATSPFERAIPFCSFPSTRSCPTSRHLRRLTAVSVLPRRRPNRPGGWARSRPKSLRRLTPQPRKTVHPARTVRRRLPCGKSSNGFPSLIRASNTAGVLWKCPAHEASRLAWRELFSEHSHLGRLGA
jgi:hypothetical protein